MEISETVLQNLELKRQPSLLQRFCSLHDALQNNNLVAARFIWSNILWEILQSKRVLLRPHMMLLISFQLQNGYTERALEVSRILQIYMQDIENYNKCDSFVGSTERSWAFVESFLSLRPRSFFLPLLRVDRSTISRWSQGASPSQAAPRIRFFARLLYELTEVEGLSKEEALLWLEEPFAGSTPYRMLSQDWTRNVPPAALERFALSRKRISVRDEPVQYS